MNIFSASIFIVSVLAFAGAAKLPKEFTTCQRGNDVCLMKAIEDALPILKSGIPKLGVFPADPLRVTEMMIDQGTGPVSVKLTFRNQDLIGLSKGKLTYAKGDFTDKTYRLEIHLDTPQVILVGDYEISGKVLVLPIQGIGHDNLTLNDFSAKIIIDGHIVQRNGEDYVEIDDFKLNFDTKRLYINLENLFNGDKALGDNMIVFLNENWSDILRELQPSIEDAFSAILKEIASRVYSKVPYKQIHLI